MNGLLAWSSGVCQLDVHKENGEESQEGGPRQLRIAATVFFFLHCVCWHVLAVRVSEAKKAKKAAKKLQCPQNVLPCSPCSFEPGWYRKKLKKAAKKKNGKQKPYWSKYNFYSVFFASSPHVPFMGLSLCAQGAINSACPRSDSSDSDESSSIPFVPRVQNPNRKYSHMYTVTGALLVVTSASLVVTGALLVVTSASLVVTGALLVVTSASLLERTHIQSHSMAKWHSIAAAKVMDMGFSASGKETTELNGYRTAYNTSEELDPRNPDARIQRDLGLESPSMAACPSCTHLSTCLSFGHRLWV